MKQKKTRILVIAGVALVLNVLLIYSLLSSKTPPTPPMLPSKQVSHPRISPTPRPRLATFSLSPAKTTVSGNDSLTLTLTLATEYELTGADAVLRFDPEFLTVQEVEAGQTFSLYPRLTYDNNTGQIIITGINIDLPSSPNFPDFATITFHAKQHGTTKVQFDFKYGTTSGSTAVRAEDAKNILSHIENAKIVIRDTSIDTGY